MDSRQHGLSLSVAWSYAFAVVLLLFIFLFLVPDADGPSPWDGQAFRSGMLETFANFRILDDLADLGIVRVADIGDGWFDAELDLVLVSDRRFGWAPFYLAVLFGAAALLLRAIRQRLFSSHMGIGPSVTGQVSSYFFGRGLNLFFPFGAGEVGTAQALIDGGAPPDAASRVVFHNRLFETMAILLVLAAGFAYRGWDGAVWPACWAVGLVLAVVSLTRPLGGETGGRRGFNPIAQLWAAFNGRACMDAVRQLSMTPHFLFGVTAISIVALGLEVLAYWCIKQAFSSPLDDYVLMKDLLFIDFAIVIAVAGTARILPYTFASVGIYEIVSVAMFRVFDQGFLGGATVSILDSLLINTLSLIAFSVVVALGKCPSVIDTWRAFFAQSAHQPDVELS